MILKCPACSSRFRVDPQLLRPDGRRVQCAKCKHRWHADPPPDELLEEVEDTAPPAAKSKPAAPARTGAPDEDDPYEEAYDEDDDYGEDADYDGASDEESYGEDASDTYDDDVSFGAAGEAPAFGAGEGVEGNAPAPKRRRARGLAQRKHFVPVLWGLVALAALGLVAVAWLGRAPLVAAIPALAPLYSLVGAGEEDPTAGLEIQNIETSRVTEAGIEFLEIDGLVVNVGDGPRTVPPLVMVLSDGEGLTIQQWMFPADAASLPAGARTAFSARMPNPSPMARDIRIEFTRTSDDR